MDHSGSNDLVTEKVKKWATQMWENSTEFWVERSSQDYAYRECLIEPHISRLIPQLSLGNSSSIVEIGCGDGSHLVFLKERLLSIGLDNVKILGIDILRSLIAKAKVKTKPYKNIILKVADVSKPETRKIIQQEVGRPNAIVAMFLLQDTPDLNGILRMARSTLKKNGHFIAVFIHPKFAQHLHEKRYLRNIENNIFPPEHKSKCGVVQWRFIGYYPIVQNNALPFYLPYFHRTLKDYTRALESYRFKIYEQKSLRLDKKVAERLQTEKISPFYKERYNIYWPLILKEPSSVLIHAIKC